MPLLPRAGGIHHWVTAGLAGRLLKEASGATSILTRSAGEAGTQVDGGAGGEVVAQALTGEYEFNAYPPTADVNGHGAGGPLL